MFEPENVLDTDFSSYSVRVSYTPVTQLPPADTGAAAVAIIRELLRGNVAEIRQTAIEANISISRLQELNAAVGAIEERLRSMEGLTEQATDGFYTSSEKAGMRAEFEELARQVNSIVGSTKYDGNKAFTAEGQTISIPLGNGSNMHIFPKDLSFDAEGLDLTADPKAAMAALRAAKERVEEIGQYIAGRYERLEEQMARLERDYGSAMGLDPSDFDITLARDMAGHTAYRARRDPSGLLEVQANVLPARAGWLLDYTGVCTQ